MNTDITAIRAKAVAFMTAAQATTYLAECHAHDARTAPVQTVTLTTRGRGLNAKVTTTEAKVITVTAPELREGDQVVITGKNGDNWTAPVLADTYLATAASQWGPKIYRVNVGQGSLVKETATYTILAR